uniref:(northern house mosquito) hypothetical protein n=1 Tax=Culex pipiens TaxID=7175 RepID=A0A8D8DQ55_CULPI
MVPKRFRTAIRASAEDALVLAGALQVQLQLLTRLERRKTPVTAQLFRKPHVHEIFRAVLVHRTGHPQIQQIVPIRETVLEERAAHAILDEQKELLLCGVRRAVSFWLRRNFIIGFRFRKGANLSLQNRLVQRNQPGLGIKTRQVLLQVSSLLVAD